MRCEICHFVVINELDLANHMVKEHKDITIIPTPPKEAILSQQTMLQYYQEITQKMYDIIKTKNQDYAGAGEAFTNFNQIELITKGVVSREFGTIVRMTDKLSRVVRLLQNTNQVLDEKIEDTLMDLANYSILLILMLKEKRESELSK